MTVLDDILDLSRIESGKMTIQTLPCSPVEVAEEVSDMLRPKAIAKGLDLSIEVDQRVPRQIATDPVRLRQILVNLVGNAVKFTDHGSILMKLDAGKNDRGEPMLLIDVIDTGIGIPADQAPLLFRPFQQGDSSTRRRFGGTGLGLAISRRLAQLLGGDISLVSEPGHGSTFSARVLAKPIKAAARAHAEVTGPTRLDGIRLLLAEDGADTRRLVCIHLRRLGCSCMAVENGQLAVDMCLEAEKSDHPFDVVLMDMQMPVMDGYSACTFLRGKGYTRAIIALTAHAMEGDRERCVQSGCDDYVVKPINVTQLSRTISKHARKNNDLAPVAT
jgi:CheY-like chemotaxis protein